MIGLPLSPLPYPALEETGRKGADTPQFQALRVRNSPSHYYPRLMYVVPASMTANLFFISPLKRIKSDRIHTFGKTSRTQHTAH